MPNDYPGVTTRFLRNDERLIISEEHEMPLVIEANGSNNLKFLQQFLSSQSENILNDLTKYGAVLLRGFDIKSEEDFENTVLKIKGFRGISEAFMSEEGRVHVGNLKYVLFTNAIYKTGGTLYLGGFHSENYYSPDVPSYICFCCFQPSTLGGETGIVNMRKIYQNLNQNLKAKLEKNSFFVSKWLISEVKERYQIPLEKIEAICKQFELPIIGDGNDKFILMYKPSIFEHPRTQEKSLGINLFEITTLNLEIRKCFMNDYQGKTWFWHRFVWRLPTGVLTLLEYIYIIFAQLFNSPKNALKVLKTKIQTLQSSHKINKHFSFNKEKVGTCFNDQEVKELAKLIRSFYSSCIWQKGDILLVDNMQVVHAGMPGAGKRLIRAMICNPIDMKYSFAKPGTLLCKERLTETIGFYMSTGKTDIDVEKRKDLTPTIKA